VVVGSSPLQLVSVDERTWTGGLEQAIATCGEGLDRSDNQGRVTSYVDAEQNETKYEWDGPHLVSVTNAVNQVTTYSGHDVFGRPSLITRTNWGDTSIVWADEGPRKISVAGLAPTYDNERLVSIETPEGRPGPDQRTLEFVADPKGDITKFDPDVEAATVSGRRAMRVGVVRSDGDRRGTK
jgi:YD repeat-containing protein